MLRILTGLPLLWLIVPGYALALVLSFFVPTIFTAIDAALDCRRRS